MTWRVDRERSSLYVWTFKAGLMARMAHDLKIEVTDYDFVVDGELGENWHAELTMPIQGFRVLGATRNKVLQVDQLSLDDKAEIEQTLRAKVLDAERHPVAFYRASFNGDENQRNFEGQLTLKGTTRPLKIQGRMERTAQGIHLEGQARILQSDFGIKPFQAFLGALKVKDEVEVSWTIYLTKHEGTEDSAIPQPL